mmetsp:Transcript_5045/g.7596  ORF Transcript_5045/g.7596 Transcript_5045/m.7596 type:complete len:99 (+) Transcript_5045:2000-2296(+)
MNRSPKVPQGPPFRVGVTSDGMRSDMLSSGNDQLEDETDEEEKTEDPTYENWLHMTEEECHQALERNPLDNFIRLRLSEILIEEERDLDEAQRLLHTI